MNATPLDSLGPDHGQEPGDDKMEQVRELLYGELRREHELRITELERRFKAFELDVTRRLDALHARLEALRAESGSDRRAAFDELARGMTELSHEIQRIARR